MTRIYDAFDKFSIVDIIFGFLFGLYLAIFHDDPNLWIFAIGVVLIFCIHDINTNCCCNSCKN